jgi:hypothetical protein
MAKQETITPKSNPSEAAEKLGAKEIRRAYFKNWYESCSETYNKERRKKRKVKKRAGKKNGNR